MLEKIIHNMSLETGAFIILVSVLAAYFHSRFTFSTLQKAPAILTTCGILGTFLGIALGLLDFNPNDVQKSVPALIEGIKTAFWASAAGVFWALTIKLRDVLFGTQRTITAQGASGATIDDLAALLSSVQQALVGNDDSTLLSQIKLARQDSNDRLDKMGQSMERFYEKIAELGSAALIEALREVIKDFNEKLTEQFGENFKQLNQAVGKILEWQEQYRLQMTEMIDQQRISSQNMSIATERYQVLVENAEVFHWVAESLSSLLEGLGTQRTQLEAFLRSFAELITKSATGLPEIEKKIVEMVRQVGDGVKVANDELRNGVKATNDEIKTVLLGAIRDSNQEFNSNIREIIEGTKKQVVVLDTALKDELTNSLESLGRQLAALSQKFVEDYTPLTDKLRRVVEMAG